MAKIGDVIQINEEIPDWCGCLLIVTDVKPWGVQAGMKIPHSGIAYLRVKPSEYELIGEAVLTEE